jgi:CheY-like chemotaxis protein
LRLSISDTGVGLAPDQVQSIFEPFYTTRPPGQGYGIGLTVVRNIVGNMGGVIEVASHRGSGTRIGVYWPLIDSGSVAQPTRRQPSTPGKGQSVLIVDDEPELVRLAEETVASLGYEAIGFADARAALEAFQRAPSRFDAVLTDQRMPMLRGTALAEAIHELRAEVPIILITGCREAETDRQAQQAGVTEILEKPLRATKLQEALGRVLGTA